MMDKRKSLYDLSWQVTEEEYRADKALSYSTISRYEREGFNELGNLFNKVESPSLTFGSMVDSLITGGDEEFLNRFIVAEFPSIPDSQEAVIKYLFNIWKDSYSSLDTLPDDCIIQATEVLNFQKNWKPETRVKVLRENGAEYYNLLYLTIDGKTLVSNKESQDANACADILRTQLPFYFGASNPFDNDIEKFYQLKFKGEYNGIALRCMMDEVIVDHTNKLIIPIDLKTSYKKEWDFYKSFIEWQYWIQAQLYAEILKQNLANDPIYKDYQILDYRFIVISNNSRIPLVWEYPDTWSTDTCYYGENKQIKCRNWREIVTELNLYLSNNYSVPQGIVIKNTNNIKKWLNKL